MSVELRIRVEGPCECGIPHRTGYEPGCRHGIQCSWGEFGDPPLIITDYQNGTTIVENISPLILVGKRFADSHGEYPCRAGDIRNVTTFRDSGTQRFMCIDADNGSWIWELFEAHWWDGEDCTVYVGRWPD